MYRITAAGLEVGRVTEPLLAPAVAAALRKHGNPVFVTPVLTHQVGGFHPAVLRVTWQEDHYLLEPMSPTEFNKPDPDRYVAYQASLHNALHTLILTQGESR